jgi:predicted nucleic acid-binding protein
VAGPGRRPAKTREVWGFEDQLLPARALVDTSFVGEALLSAQPHHERARLFLARLAEHGTVLHFNRLLEVELAEMAFRAAIAERHGRWRRERHDKRIRRRAARLMREALDAWAEALDAFAHVVFELEVVLPAVPRLMEDYGLSSYDAAHAATGLEFEPVDAIVTLDSDFAALPETVTILTVQPRVRTMRRHRGGQAGG